MSPFLLILILSSLPWSSPPEYHSVVPEPYPNPESRIFTSKYPYSADRQNRNQSIKNTRVFTYAMEDFMQNASAGDTK
jgi:hypothetical protein